VTLNTIPRRKRIIGLTVNYGESVNEIKFNKFLYFRMVLKEEAANIE
jgi:hypothetical protein